MYINKWNDYVTTRRRMLLFLVVLSNLMFTLCDGSHSFKFTVEPSDVSVSEGNSILLPCAGVATFGKLKEKIIPNIRWRGPDSQDIGIVGDTFRTQLANGSLYISSIEENRGLTGSYQCLLSVDGIGTIVSRWARVSIASLPETDNIFREIHLYVGQTAYFNCLAKPMQHGVTYHIQWLKDDAQLRLDESRMFISPSGAIEIDDLKLSDSGTYQCNVTFGHISKLSSKSTLNINSTNFDDTFAFQAPIFLTESSSKIVLEGNSVTLDCVANGNPRPHLKWLRNGEEIDIRDLDSRYRITGIGSLQITSIEENDSGNYQCRAKNQIESSDIQVAVQVQVPPKFVESPTDKIAHVKDEIEFVCIIHGKPTPVIQWLKNGDVITPNEYMFIVGGHNLRITGLLIDDAGMFQCVGSNPTGSIQAAARLNIESADGHWMKNILDSLSVTHNKDYSDDYEDYDDYSDDKIYHIDKNTDPNKLLNSLTNKKNNKSSNEMSHVNESSVPNVTHKYPSNVDANVGLQAPIPGPPRDLITQIVDSRFVALSWMEPLKNPDEVISYTVYYKISTSERERKITTKSRDEQMTNIQSLLPGKTYQFRVVGNSNYGPGESSKIYEVNTQPDENISGPPQSFKGTVISDREIFLQWDPPLLTNGNITKYRVCYIENEGYEMCTDTALLETTLNDVRPYTEYTITVAAVNQNGMGDPSNEIILKTFSSVPGEPPTNVTLETTSSTSITIRWEPPPIEEQNGQITGYKIRYRKQRKQLQYETTPANVRHYELKELDKLSPYQVKIAAMTVNGTGPFTEWLHIETYENDLSEKHVPGVPVGLKARAGAGSITVSWTAPAMQEIKVRGYILGWGLGIPDVDTHELDENARSYLIKDLQPNSEYVISLRARNVAGDGPPQYETVRTREDEPFELSGALEVPVGLRAMTMSLSSIVVYWTDTTLNRNQKVSDNRYYVVRYNTVESSRNKKYYNVTDLNCMIDNLKPNTQYEFAVKVVKGRRESAYSMSVLNTTFPALLVSAPRDLVARLDEQNPQNIILEWLPPKHNIGLVNGYIIFGTNDTSKRDRDWTVVDDAIFSGDTTTFTMKNLNPHTTYYFKVQARLLKGANGPFSTMVTQKTGHHSNTIPQEATTSFPTIIYNNLIYIIVAISILTLIIATIVVTTLCRRKPVSTPEHSKMSYQKNNAGIKPPDLWIHHDQMELKNIEKNHNNNNNSNNNNNNNNTPGCSDGASSSGAMTLPRSVGHEYEADQPTGSTNVTNSLDKRSYVPGYMTTSMNSTMERSQYPRTQYNINTNSRNVNSQIDAPNISQQNLHQIQQQQSGNTMTQAPENAYGYDSMPSNYSNPSVTYAPGLSIDAPKRGQGHPLKSFSVPGPPALVAPLHHINQAKHAVPTVTIRPQNASPYKKPPIINTLPNRLQAGPCVAHSTDEIQRLAPSNSTEELNQEMANLEGLMKDLSAITANEFEC